MRLLPCMLATMLTVTSASVVFARYSVDTEGHKTGFPGFITANVHPQMGSVRTDSVSVNEGQPGDSVMYRSVSDGELPSNDSFLSRHIPLSPNAAALARYAEYPVSHTTGIPDISIPLYEIKLGDFTLPISISYHASGFRVDERPTTVGLGWSLNAGGCVTRTILGKPDLYGDDVRSTDYTYYSVENVRALTGRIIRDSDAASMNTLVQMTKDYTSPDTESDRYTFNVGGRTGIFRYSFRDREYVILNNSNDHIESWGHYPNSSFTLHTADNTEYVFGCEEQTGVTDAYNEKPFTSSWNLTEIHTPWGDVTFTYEGGHSVSFHAFSVSATAGVRPEYYDNVESNGESSSIVGFFFRTKSTVSPYTISHDQRLLRRIEWNGNRIEFEYVDEYPGHTLCRLVSMKVMNREGETVRAVTFDNTDNWPTGNSRTGRRLLRSVSDSQSGTYLFSYNKDLTPPPLGLSLGHSPACESDLWGYWNTSEPGLADQVFLESQDRWLTEYITEAGNIMNPGAAGGVRTRDRSPSLPHTRTGVLEKIEFPTGGSVKFEYELNTTESGVCGGLRVRRMTLSENPENSYSTTYSYLGMAATEEPEALMNYHTYELIGFEKSLISSPAMFRTCSEFPVSPATYSGPPAVYHHVTESRDDGSSTTFRYHQDELAELFGVSTYHSHPSLFDQALLDVGTHEPLLLEKNVYDTRGTLVSSEEYTYDRRTRRTFSAGVRVFSQYIQYDIDGSRWNTNTDPSTPAMAWGDVFQYADTRTRVRANLLLSRTETDHTTGFSRTTLYAYDDSLRTVRPRSESITNSDGTVHRMEYSYPFDFSDPVSVDMTDQWITDLPVAVRKYGDGELLHTVETEYALFRHSADNWRYRPTATYTAGPDRKRRERERVLGYNSLGRPLAVVSETADTTRMTWDPTGDRLLSVTTPGGLTTSYTHSGLIGLNSTTSPNGNVISYTYNSAGLLEYVGDRQGTIATYKYSLQRHTDPGMTGEGNSVTTETWLDAAGNCRAVSRQYCDGLGRPTVMADKGVNTTGEIVYTVSEYDRYGRENRKWLPLVGNGDFEDLGSTASLQVHPRLPELGLSTYSDTNPYTETTYDGLGRPVYSQTSGEEWHKKSKGVTTTYVTNGANDVRLYRVSVTADGMEKAGYYPAGTLSGVRTEDEDGNIMTVFTDRLGQKVLERRGTDSKDINDTYYVYDALGRLRHVLSPEYQRAGYKEDYGYEYRYDTRGNVVKKLLPQCGTTQYWYDRAGRMDFVRDPMLESAGLWRFIIYDLDSRPCIQGTCSGCDRTEGRMLTAARGTPGGGFHGTGYSVEGSSSLVGVTLEKVLYYDDHTLITGLDSRLSYTSAVPQVSQKGFQTGYVTYNSDGTETMGSVYRDLRGNVTETHDIGVDGRPRTVTNTYTHTNAIDTSVTSGPGLYLYTVNTYDGGSGLLTGTTLTANGVTDRVTALSYDRLGRVVSDSRGTSNTGGTVTRSYNLHGQVTDITGPGFSQVLHYTDGPGTPLYNGSVSSMAWTMRGRYAADNTVRGYRYTYDSFGRLTEAKYGETDRIDDNYNRYTEKVLEYSPNGMMKRFQRHGLKANHVHGKIDNLHIKLDGNRVQSVLEDADPVTEPGSMDYAGDSPGNYLHMTYDKSGNLKTDRGRGITDITYDMLNHPVKVTFSNGNVTEYVYSADGEKLKVTHKSGVANAVAVNDALTLSDTAYVDDAAVDDTSPTMAEVSAMETDELLYSDSAAAVTTDETSYWGNVLYRDNKPYMLLFTGGYVTFDNGTLTFHYYTKDYLGNNRTVVNGTTGEIEQSVAYYPFGGVIANLGFGHGDQQYKFGGKELDMAHGLNEYDFGARRYYQGVPTFTQPDPMAEKYYWLSPYVYCGDNPVNNIDPSGCKIEGVAKRDAAMAVKDFRAMFPGDEFANFRNLIVQSGKKQNGKSLSSISSDALSAAFSGVSLNDDQQALVDIVVNTINSNDVHKIEYLSPGRDMSSESIRIMGPKLESLGITQEMASGISGGYSSFVMALCGDASTTPISNGSLSLIKEVPDDVNSNRPAIVGHEVIGHGRSYKLGYRDSQSQHVLPIQIENLILRNMGISSFRDGTDHAPLKSFIPNHMSIPILR